MQKMSKFDSWSVQYLFVMEISLTFLDIEYLPHDIRIQKSECSSILIKRENPGVPNDRKNYGKYPGNCETHREKSTIGGTRKFGQRMQDCPITDHSF